MKTDFVIVVEVDNKRAHAAYLKGVEDLERIWPQIMAVAAVVDAKAEEEADKREAERKQRAVERKARIDAYQSVLDSWHRLPLIFRGPPPISPLIMPEMPDYGFLRVRLADYYESIRNELKRMERLAGAALGPYRMTESQVSEMIAWEDGSRIDQIKEKIAAHQAV